MRTDLNPAASYWSRVVHVFVILWLICGADVVEGQPVHVEWLNFEEDGVGYLVLNAYEADTDLRSRSPLESEHISPARPAFHRLGEPTVRSRRSHGSRKVYPLIVEDPLRDVPDSPEAQAFLGVLEKLGDSPGPASSWKPKTLEQWDKLLRLLTTRHEIWLHGRVIRSSEVAGVLKEIYAVRGYPSGRHPIFPHLERGLLAVLDSDGRPLTSIDVAFDQAQSGAPVYRTVTFANVGSEPLRVYIERETRAPIRLSGAPSLLYPAERTSSRLKLEQSLFAVTRQESKALLRYASGGVELDAFEIRAHHSGWIHSASAALAGTAAVVFGSLVDLGLPHIPIAAAGLLISLLIIAVLRTSADVPAPASSVRVHVDRLRRHGQQIVAVVADLSGRAKFLLDALYSAASRLSARTSDRVIALKNRTASTPGRSIVADGFAQESLQRAFSRGVGSLRHAARGGAIICWEASVRGMASLRETSSRRRASLQEASGRRAASLVKASGRGMATIREASLSGMATIRKASLGGMATIQQTSLVGMATIRKASLVGLTRIREASLRGVAVLREASLGGAAMLREASSGGVASLREASSRGVAKLRAAFIRFTALITKGAASSSAMFRHGFALPVRRRSAVYFQGLFERALRAWNRVLVRGRRLRMNLLLYREFVSEPIPPRDGKECVDRIRRLTRELRSNSTTSFSPAARRRLLKETTRMARRLESDLAHEKVPQTTINFQILWALRLLLEILNGPPQKTSASVHRWLDGADRVLRNGAHDGVGPTVPEFLSLVTPEYEIGGGHSQRMWS